MTTNTGDLINCHKGEGEGEIEVEEKIECDVITEGGYYINEG